MRYKCSDSDYEFIYNGSAWVPFWQGTAVKLPPSISSMTRRHAAGTSAFDFEEDSKGPVTFKQATGASYNVNALHKAYSPGGTYSLILGFNHILNAWSNQVMIGMMLRQESANQQVIFGVGLTTSQTQTLILLNNTSYGGANPYTAYSPGWAWADRRWIRFEDDGTNWTFYTSLTRPTSTNKGMQAYQMTRNTYITPDRIGWGFAANASDTIQMTVFDFEEGT